MRLKLLSAAEFISSLCEVAAKELALEGELSNIETVWG